jgi:hypothetical protein
MGAAMPPVLAFIAPVAAFLGVSSATLIIGVLATAAQFGLSYLQAQKLKKAQKSSVGQEIQQNIRQSTYPRYCVLGKARVGGLMLFYEAANKKLYLATILSDDIIDSIAKYYVRDFEVLVDGGGYVTTAPFNAASGKYVRFELKYGYTDQAASTILAAAFPGVITANHIAAGVAYLVTELTQTSEADFQPIFNSTVPEIAALVNGVLVWDMRDTAQDVDLARSWRTTTNPALLLLHYFSAVNGMAMRRSLFAGDLFEQVADYCDELVPDKAGGSRKRYEMGGVYGYDDDPVEVIDKILNTFAGQVYVTANGLFGLSCDGLDVADITITEDMIIEIEAKRNTGALYEYSTVKSRFTSETHGYTENNEEADPWIDTAARERIGRDIPFSLDLPYVFRHDQARRLMKRKWHQVSPEWSITMALDYNGLELFGERIFRLVYAPLGIDGDFRLESVAPDAEQGLAKILVQCVSINAQAAAWDPVTEEGTAPAVPPVTTETAVPLPPSGLTALVGDTDAGAPFVGRALLSWISNTTGHLQEAEYKLSSDTVWTPATVAAADRAYVITGLTAAVDYDFRVRVTDTKYGVSNWTSITFNATATGGTTGALLAFTATGGVNKLTGNATQSSAATAAYVEVVAVATGAPLVWTGSTLNPVKASGSVSYSITKAAGTYDVYARSVGINGDVGAASGPITITVTAQIVNDGSSGSSSVGGNQNGGNGGSGRNDSGGGTNSSNDPGQGSGGVGPGTGGLY